MALLIPLPKDRWCQNQTIGQSGLQRSKTGNDIEARFEKGSILSEYLVPRISNLVCMHYFVNMQEFCLLSIDAPYLSLRIETIIEEFHSYMLVDERKLHLVLRFAIEYRTSYFNITQALF